MADLQSVKAINSLARQRAILDAVPGGDSSALSPQDATSSVSLWKSILEQISPGAVDALPIAQRVNESALLRAIANAIDPGAGVGLTNRTALLRTIIVGIDPDGLGGLSVVQLVDDNALLRVIKTLLDADPVADFIADATSGTAPLTVSFTDLSTNSPTSWLWSKNDGGGWIDFESDPTAQNPDEIFDEGSWSIRLKASNIAGESIVTKTDYINVTSGIIIQDTFTGVNGTELTSHVADTGQSWTNVLGISKLMSNRVVPDSFDAGLSGESLHRIAGARRPNQIVCDLRTGDLEVKNRILLRFTDNNNFCEVIINHDNDQLELYMKVAGDYTLLDATSLGDDGSADNFVGTLTIMDDGEAIAATLTGGFEVSASSTFNNTEKGIGLGWDAPLGIGFLSTYFDNLVAT